jgi:hypothetical protein
MTTPTNSTGAAASHCNIIIRRKHSAHRLGAENINMPILNSYVDDFVTVLVFVRLDPILLYIIN